MPEAQVDQAFQALDDAFAEYANAKNADELAEAYYAEDASVLPPNHPRVNGQPQIRDFWKGAIDQGLTDVLLNLLEVHEAGDFAWGIGEYSLAIAPSGQVVRDSGKYLLVFRDKRTAPGRSPSTCGAATSRPPDGSRGASPPEEKGHRR